MIEIECTARKIGNSIGVTFPKEVVEKANIKENEKIKIKIEDKPKVKEFFGLLKDRKKPTQQLKDEMRKGWEK